MLTIEVKKNQSLMDIALQEYGDVGFAYQLVKDNGLNGVTDNVNEGDTLLITEGLGNGRIRDNLKPFTIATIDDATKADGIGWWEINDTFIIGS